MLAGAMAELKVGDPGQLSTDVGPVIDADALGMLDRHAERMQGEARLIAQAAVGEDAAHGTFFAPRAWELKSLRSEEHTSELQSLMRISYAVFCLNNTQILQQQH